jgi:hypothetical protein
MIPLMQKPVLGGNPESSANQRIFHPLENTVARLHFNLIFTSVADPDPNPDPDPPDPHVFGPPGSGSFYYHAKIVRKTLIPTIL